MKTATRHCVKDIKREAYEIFWIGGGANSPRTKVEQGRYNGAISKPKGSEGAYPLEFFCAAPFYFDRNDLFSEKLPKDYSVFL